MRVRWLPVAVSLLSAACSEIEQSAATGADDVESARRWTSESEVATMPAFDALVVAYWREHVRRLSLVSGVAGPPVTVEVDALLVPRERERGAIVFSHGLGESSFRYAELARDLHRAGFSLYLTNHRGQGFSTRLLDDPTLVHVDAFQDYVDDLALVAEHARAAGHERLFAIGHSMGGGILTRLLEERPHLFRAAVLSAPMHELPSEGLLWTLTAFGDARAKVDASLLGGGGAENDVTHSAARFEAGRHLLELAPTTLVTVPTNGWVGECLSGTSALREEAEKLVDPLLVLSAGDDRYVVSSAHEQVCNSAQRCRLVSFPEARHEILQERDSIRDRALDAIVEHFEASP